MSNTTAQPGVGTAQALPIEAAKPLITAAPQPDQRRNQRMLLPRLMKQEIETDPLMSWMRSPLNPASLLASC